jgi:chorismate mutase/prephenate dehydratase
MEDNLNAQLGPLRQRIDALDAQLIALLNQRAQVALEVGEVKQRFNAPVFRPEREMQVIERLQCLSAGPLTDSHVAAIWREIMSASRALEHTIGVAFLGPVGTYSEEAMLGYFGQSVSGLPCLSIDEAFRAVEAGGADYAVVPVENSSEGAVSRTLDLLLTTPLLITGEIALPIHHNLLTQRGDLSAVTRVCAHPQALAQCQQWLSAHLPGIARESVSSNAEAARLATQDASIAAIAGDRAATHYGLTTSYAMIQDDPHNRTRFVVVGGLQPEPTGRDQTSMILSVNNRPGALFTVLEPLARYGVSMNRFESRPARVGGWEYYFYVDLEGHRLDASLVTALEELKQAVPFLKVLGSYPRAH